MPITIRELLEAKKEADQKIVDRLKKRIKEAKDGEDVEIWSRWLELLGGKAIE